jgi:hypothetical protein
MARLWSGWSGVRVPTGEGIYLSCEIPRSALGPTEPPIQTVAGFFTWNQPAEVLRWPPISISCEGKQWVELYIYVVFLKYNQQDATFSRSVYFYKLLYIFQAVPPPIIRSTKLYLQRQVLSDQYCCLLLSWMRWNYMSLPKSVVQLFNP